MSPGNKNPPSDTTTAISGCTKCRLVTAAEKSPGREGDHQLSEIALDVRAPRALSAVAGNEYSCVSEPGGDAWRVPGVPRVRYAGHHGPNGCLMVGRRSLKRRDRSRQYDDSA